MPPNCATASGSGKFVCPRCVGFCLALEALWQIRPGRLAFLRVGQGQIVRFDNGLELRRVTDACKEPLLKTATDKPLKIPELSRLKIGTKAKLLS